MFINYLLGWLYILWVHLNLVLARCVGKTFSMFFIGVYRWQSVFALVLPTSGTIRINIDLMETFLFSESKLLHIRLLRFPVMEG